MNELKQIASFSINHDTLVPGLYLSRVDGEVRTYDLRFVRPNTPPFMEVAAMHTMEHLFATYVRSSEYEDKIVYFGPMGCRTGFYFLVQGGMTAGQVIELTQRALQFIAGFSGAVPGATARECGNYREHDLPGARALAAAESEALAGWTVEKLAYPQ